MFGDRGFQRSREGFAAQFEPCDGGRFLYRRNQKGPPIPVSAEERQRFTDAFGRSMGYALAGLAAAMTAMIGLIVWWSAKTRSDPGIMLYAGMIALIAVFVAGTMRIYTAPARELEGRSPVGAERSREEMRARLLARLSYGQLALVAVAGVLAVVRAAAREDVLSGWHRLWLLFGAAMVLLAAVQAFRKWRFESEERLR